MKGVENWFKSQNWKAQSFQKKCWKAYAEGKSGMLHAPTGSGKTYALWGGVVEEISRSKKNPIGLNALWITPLRALGVEIQKSKVFEVRKKDVKIASPCVCLNIRIIRYY